MPIWRIPSECLWQTWHDRGTVDSMLELCKGLLLGDGMALHQATAPLLPPSSADGASASAGQWTGRQLNVTSKSRQGGKVEALVDPSEQPLVMPGVYGSGRGCHRSRSW